ncbi:hypothetical protein CFIMG_000687RA [Ceratocystis fimbriata CBS 114723]|uniref:L-dopachrome isomerase n=1 Tax=Ceratocystis fimbriata CBS 114723 TaxID=1035309 RepID=A0A2C5X9B6_9PEZI|nr:hypothetical protein CFIMG_000687RA [Ceratocystis fimbriata CBS 114723]
MSEHSSTSSLTDNGLPATPALSASSRQLPAVCATVPVEKELQTRTSFNFNEWHTSPEHSPVSNSKTDTSTITEKKKISPILSSPPPGTPSSDPPFPSLSRTDVPHDLVPCPLRPCAYKDGYRGEIDPEDALVLARNPQDRIRDGIIGRGAPYEHLPPVGSQPSFTTRMSHASGHPPMLRPHINGMPLHSVNEDRVSSNPAKEQLLPLNLGYGHQVPPVISPRASIKMSTNAYGMPLVPQTHEYTGRVSRQSVIKPRSMIYGQSSNSSLSASFDHMGLSLSKQLSNLPMSNTLGELDVKHAPHGIDAVDEPPEDEDFIRQTSMVMVDLLTNVHIEKECPVLEELTIQISKRYKRPVSSIAISLRHGACMVYGGSMDPAYILTLYAEPSQVLEATNRRNTILLQRVLRDTLTVPPSRGTIRFVAVPDECLGHNNTTLRNEIKELQRQRQQHQVKRGREHEREPRSVSPAKKNLPTTPVKAKPVDLKQSRSLLKMKSLVGIRPVMMDPVSSSANPDINDVSPPRHSTDSKRAVLSTSVTAANGAYLDATSDSEAGGSPGWRMPLAPRTPSRRVVTSPMQVSPTPSPRPAQTQPQPQAKGVDNDRLVKSKKSFVSLMFGRRVKGDGSPLKNENVPPV